MDKFSDMQMFVSIIKHQGLAAGGRELGLSPASVTARLQALEDRYGIKLLNRSTRRLFLTDAGELYYKKCLEIIESVNETEHLLQKGVKEVKGTLKIVAPKDIGKQYIFKIISEFSTLYPEIVPYLYLNDHMVNTIDAGVDIVIGYGELADSSLISRKLATSKRVLCASPQYLEKYGTPLTPENLENHNCLAMLRSHEELKIWHFQSNSESKESKKSITVTPKRFSDDGEVIRYWALEGEGIALKSELDIQTDLKANRLVTVLDNHMKNFDSSATVSSSNLNVIYLSREYQPKRIRLFLDFLFEQFAIIERENES